jgi:hypothetical protein
MKKTIIPILIIVMVLATGLIIWQMVERQAAKKKELEEHFGSTATPEYNLTVVIKPYQYGKKKECKGVWREGITALDATLECDKTANLGMKLRYDPEIHKAQLVDEIMGLRHTNENNRYWLYYVNNKFITDKAVDMLNDPARMYQGKKSEPMPERFYLKPGDQVEWRFEEWVTLKETEKK